ncbi:MAG: FmdE family protein [Candidatus Brocadiia bacterium]
MNDPRREIKRLLREGDLRGLLVRTAALHGHYCPGVAYGVKAGYAAVRRLGFDNTGMEELVAVVECNNCFVDGVQMTTGCSFGNNALIYRDLGKTAVTVMSRRTEEAVRVALRPNRWESEDATEREKEASELFRRVVKEREDDPEAARRMQELWRELSFETVGKPEDELFEIADVPAEFPAYAPIHDSATCAGCGEEVMETRAALREGRVVCLDCAGADCMAVTGRGIHVLRDGQFC